MISWGPFRPDVGGPNSGMAEIADGVLVQSAGSGVGYGPLPSLVAVAAAVALPGAPRGSISLRLFIGDQRVYFATATTIQELQADYSWTAISTGLTVTPDDDMSFCHFGSYLLNTNTTDGFKAYNLEVPAGNNAVAGAPTARYIFSCNNVIFALDCNGSNRRMQSSGIGDHTAWNRLGANGKTFEDGGALVWGADLKNGAAIIMQEDASRLVQFGGAPGGALYTIAKIADGRGAIGERSCVSFDGMVFYLATDGFYKFTLAGGNEPIGAEKINSWFLNLVDQARLTEVQGSVDPLNKVVWFRFPTLADASPTVFEGLIGYDWQIGEWVTAPVFTAALARLATPGYNLGSAGAAFGTLAGAPAIPIGSRFWQGGQPVFAALDAGLKFATFSGTPIEATLRSCVMNSPLTSLIGWATPISDAPNSTLTLGTNDNLADPIVFNSPESKVRNGATPQRIRGMNLQMEENIPAGDTWTYSNGVDHIKSAQGGSK